MHNSKSYWIRASLGTFEFFNTYTINEVTTNNEVTLTDSYGVLCRSLMFSCLNQIITTWRIDFKVVSAACESKNRNLCLTECTLII